MKKKRNPSDLTGRNNKARKSDHAKLKERVVKLEKRVRALETR